MQSRHSAGERLDSRETDPSAKSRPIDLKSASARWVLGSTARYTESVCDAKLSLETGSEKARKHGAVHPACETRGASSLSPTSPGTEAQTSESYPSALFAEHAYKRASHQNVFSLKRILKDQSSAWR